MKNENSCLNFHKFWERKDSFSKTKEIIAPYFNDFFKFILMMSLMKENYYLLNIKKDRENNNIENDNIFEDKKGIIKLIDNSEDKLFDLDKFENNGKKIE